MLLYLTSALFFSHCLKIAVNYKCSLNVSSDPEMQVGMRQIACLLENRCAFQSTPLYGLAFSLWGSLLLGCFSQVFSWSNVRYKILCTWTGNRKVEFFFSRLLWISHCYECDCGAGFVRQQNNVPFQQGWLHDILELYSAVLWVRGLGVKKNTALLINLSAGTFFPPAWFNTILGQINVLLVFKDLWLFSSSRTLCFQLLDNNRA